MAQQLLSIHEVVLTEDASEVARAASTCCRVVKSRFVPAMARS